MRWQGRPSAPVLLLTAPVASVVLMQLKGTLPQMYVGLVPTAMRLRPYAEPNEPPTANAGTSSLSTYCTLVWYVVRSVHSRLRWLIGTTVKPASMPRVDIWPPLIVCTLRPELGGSGKSTSRSLMTRSYLLTSSA